MTNPDTDLAIKHLEGFIALFKETFTGVKVDDEYQKIQVARLETFLKTLYERRSA